MFKDLVFDNKEYVLPKGPVKKIKLYENIIEIHTIFPTELKIEKDLKIIVKGKEALDNELFQFKNIKIKDLINLLAQELNYNIYYISDIPDKDISLNLKEFYPEDLFRIIFDSFGINYYYVSTKDIYISNSPLYDVNYPIINSDDIDENYEFVNANIPNFSNLISLIGLDYVKINDSLYILKGKKDKIELIRNILSKVPNNINIENKSSNLDKSTIDKSTIDKSNINNSNIDKTNNDNTVIDKTEESKVNDKENKKYEVFLYDLPQKDIIKIFDLDYVDISDNVLLLMGTQKNLELFKEYYNTAKEVYDNNSNISVDNKTTVEATIIESNYDLKNLSKFFDIDVLNIEKNIYLVKGKDIDKLKKITENTHDDIQIINTEIPLENLNDLMNIEVIKIDKDIYIIKGKDLETVNNILTKINEIKINKKDNINNKENNEKIETINSNLNLLVFNEIFKDVIIQKIEKNYIIKGTEDTIRLIKDFNDKYNKHNTEEFYLTIHNNEYEKFKKISSELDIEYNELYKEDSNIVLGLKTSEENYLKLKDLFEKESKFSAYELLEDYAKENNLTLLNNEKLKDIIIYNPSDIENILDINGYYLEKRNNIISVKEKNPNIISIEIAIVDSSILEETIEKIESKISSKSIIESINQGIINPSIYKEILDSVFESTNINSKSNSKLLSKPKIILKSGTNSVFKSVYRVPVINESSIQYIESGLTLEIEANYLDYNDLIDLKINLKVGEPEKSAISNYNAENSREINTNLLLKNNYVSILGGLKIIKEEKLNSGIPFLKDLPIIGFLFRTNEQRNREYDLNVFIWPKIVNYGGD
ncbi:hypothetical protein JOC61_000410 [Marinitoga litoralis]|nr:hypothetical protein [Marinitoga litoralis]